MIRNLEEDVKPEIVFDSTSAGISDLCSIIVVHKDRPDYLNICIQSIHICSHLNNYEVIVVDNGSTNPETFEYLNLLESQGFKILRRNKNTYWSHGANEGVKLADPNSKYFIFMHADTVVLDPTWIDVLINVASVNNSGMVGCSLSSYAFKGQKIDFVQEWCLLMSRDCWTDVGPWSEELPVLGSSFIMSLKAQYKGYRPQAIKNHLVHHYKAFSYDPIEYKKFKDDSAPLIAKAMQKIQMDI